MSTRPKRRAVPSEKALDLARDDVAKREAARAAAQVGFAALGQQHARDLEAAGGDEQAAGGDGDDVEVVAAPAAKQARVRKSTKWPLTYDLALARAGLQNEVWKVNGSGRPVGERWDACWKTLNQEPLVRIFKSKTSKICKARYDKIVDDQSKSDGKAKRDSGAGTAESSSEDEGEKNMKIELEKVLTAIVDAKAAAKHDSEETKQKKADDAASHSAMGTWAINQGNARCGPGAKATSFQEAVAADNIAWGSRSGAAAGGRASGRVSLASSIGGARPASEASAGGENSGRSSPTMSTGGIDDDLSPAGSGPSRKVPPLRGLVKHMGSLSIPTLAQSAGVTTEEADYFLNAGFTADEVQPERAVAMMTVLLDKRLNLQRDGDSVEDFVEEQGGDEDAQLPGFDGFDESVMFDLLDLYGVEKKDFDSLPDSKWFHSGWPVERVTPGKVLQVTKRVARLLVLGAGVTNSGLSAAGQTSIPGSAAVGGARAMSGMDPSGASSRASGNRGRKTRAKTNKLAEEGLDSFMERQVAQAQKLADQKRQEDERRRGEADKRELGRRQELLDMMAHERAMREDERKHDRQEREEERAAARAEQKADRDHQIRMMQLQVDLAKAKGNKN